MKHEWMIDDALGLIRALQPVALKNGYHLLLGGGVLNKGYSDKDLDLYFLPLSGERDPKLQAGMCNALVSLWGPGEKIGSGDYPDEELYFERLKFTYSGSRIDVFIV